jgi:hypothetical protein
MRTGTILAATLVSCGIAIHAFGLLVDAGGARLVGLVPYVLGLAALIITRAPVVACCAIAVPLLIDAALVTTFIAGTSGGVGDLGFEWAMIHYLKLLVIFPVGLYAGIRLADSQSGDAPSNNKLQRTRGVVSERSDG